MTDNEYTSLQITQKGCYDRHNEYTSLQITQKVVQQDTENMTDTMNIQAYRSRKKLFNKTQRI